MENKKIATFAMVGLGSYGRSHLSRMRVYSQKNMLKLLAVSEMNQSNIELCKSTLDEMQTAIYNDAETMFKELQGKVDVVVLPVGIAQHAPLTVKALEYGFNVMVEKPLAGSVAEGQKVIDAAAKTDKFVAIGYQNTYDPEAAALKEIILSGKLGKLKKVNGLALMPRGRDYYARNPWVGKLTVNGMPVYDSPLNNAMAHVVNLALYFAGKSLDEVATPVSVEGQLYRGNKIESFDSAAVRWMTDNGIELNISGSHTVWETYNSELTVECENGRMIFQLNGCANAIDSNGNVIYSSFAQNAGMRVYTAAIDKLQDSSAKVFTPEMAIKQSMAIEMLHDQLKIEDVPEHCLTERESDGIKNFARQSYYWRAAYIQGCLPAEIGWKVE